MPNKKINSDLSKVNGGSQFSAGQNSNKAPEIDTNKCNSCGECVNSCERKAIVVENGQYSINGNCIRCGKCLAYCKENAIEIN